MATTPGKKRRARPALKKRPSAPAPRKKAAAEGKSGKKAKAGTVQKSVRKPAKTKGGSTAARRGASTRRVTRPAKKKALKKAAKPEQDRFSSLRKMLNARRNTILREAKQEISKYLSGENRQLVDTALDDGDWAVVDISEDINLRMLSTHRSVLRDIDQAIRKINEGTYGICEECGEEISEKRLSILPAAVLCIDCQENKEKLEGLVREESL